MRGLRFSLPRANAHHGRRNEREKCLVASSDRRIRKVLPCSRLRHGFNRLVRVYGVASCSVYEFCAAAPKSSRGLGGARELEMGRPAANCPACEQKRTLHKARQTGAGEIRCTGLPRRYHRYAVPSPGSERTSLAQTKSYAKCPGAPLGTGRRTKILSKI